MHFKPEAERLAIASKAGAKGFPGPLTTASYLSATKPLPLLHRPQTKIAPQARQTLRHILAGDRSYGESTEQSHPWRAQS